MTNVNRYSSYRAACKQWSVGLAVLILLVGGLASLNATKLMWAAGPLLLIGLVEAGYAVQERRSNETPERASAQLARTGVAVLSLSIWPFYLGLFSPSFPKLAKRFGDVAFALKLCFLVSARSH